MTTDGDLPWVPKLPGKFGIKVLELCDEHSESWRLGSFSTIDSYLSKFSDPEEKAVLIFRLCAVEAKEHADRPAARDTSVSPAKRQPSFLGSYDITGELGRGGFARVFRAVDRVHQREVAIKLVHFDTEELRVRFRTEVKAMVDNDCPHLLRIYDANEIANCGYLIMPVVDLTLADYLDKYERLNGHRRLAPAEVARLGVQIASGLKSFHANGGVHRDITPRNIGLKSDDTGKSWRDAVLMDFGLARLEGQLMSQTSAQSLRGTPQYMAPEQFKRSPDHFKSRIRADGLSDLFSLGSVLFEACAGQKAFDGSLGDIIAQILDPDYIPTLPPEIASDHNSQKLYEYLTQRLLAKERERRVQSAAKAHEDLADLCRELAPRNRVERAILQINLPITADCNDGLAMAPRNRFGGPARNWMVLRVVLVGTILLSGLYVLGIGLIQVWPGMKSVASGLGDSVGSFWHKDITDDPIIESPIYSSTHHKFSAHLKSESSVRNRRAFVVRVTLTNSGRNDLPTARIAVVASPQNGPVTIQRMQFQEGNRIGETNILGLRSGTSQECEVSCIAPAKPGKYKLFLRASDPLESNFIETDDMGWDITVY